MPHLIDYAELNSILHTLTSLTSYYYSTTQIYLRLLLDTGCRTRELVQKERWSQNIDTSINLVPEKFNNVRHFNDEELNTLIPFYIINPDKPFFGITVRQMQYDWSRYSPYASYKVNDKDMKQYLFRYRYVRYLDNLGLTPAEITAIMGWLDDFTVFGYLENEIYGFP